MLDFETPIASLDPYPFLSSMQQQHPVWYSGEWHGWQIFRYTDARKILFDHELYSSVLPLAHPEHPFSTTISFLDPPQHTRLRKLVAHAFTPQRIGLLAPKIQAITNELLSQVANEERMDVIADFASPLPVLVIAEVLGIPAEDQKQFLGWVEKQVAIASMRDLQIIPEMQDYFKWIMAQRRADTQHDLMSALVCSHIDNQPLSEQEILGFCSLLLVAGSETTRHLIGNALLCFDSTPQERPLLAHLRSRPDLLPSAIEEVLRYLPPFPATRRVAKKHVRIGEQEIAEGDLLTVRIDAANRDERQFSAANTFQLERFPNPLMANHLSFGHGIHFCIGAPLARLEAKIALGNLFTCFPEMGRDHTVPLERVDGLLVYGVKRLPVIIKKGGGGSWK